MVRLRLATVFIEATTGATSRAVVERAGDSGKLASQYSALA